VLVIYCFVSNRVLVLVIEIEGKLYATNFHSNTWMCALIHERRHGDFSGFSKAESASGKDPELVSVLEPPVSESELNVVCLAQSEMRRPCEPFSHASLERSLWIQKMLQA